MKKALFLTNIFFLLSTICVFAYETIIIKFPERELWVKAYYKKVGNEAILQYVPQGQSSNNWRQSVVVHSYKYSTYPLNVFVTNNTTKMIKTNPTSAYKTIRYTTDDMILGRCTENYGKVEAQCEFFKAMRSHEGIMTIHYMNKNKNDFMANYSQWYNIIKKSKSYYSYYRDERIMDKAEFFEL